MLVFDCPSCGGKLQMPENLAGKKVRCATCQAVITAPAGDDATDAIQADAAPGKATAPTAVTEKAHTAPQRMANDDDDLSRRGPRRDRSDPATKKGKGAGAIIAVLVVLAVGCVGCGGVGVVVLLMFPAVISVQNAAGRAQTMNNMKQVALGNINYCDTNRGEMPTPKALVPPQKLQAVDLSWRVSILPFVEEGPLFNRFNQTVAWDQMPNQGLLSPMPRVYENPYRDQGNIGTATHFQYFTGPETLWPDNGKKRFPASFIDGTSNTFLFAEAAAPVPWSKPADMAVQRNAPPPLPTTVNFMVAFADGSVRNIDRRKVNDQMIFAGITPAAGDMVPNDWNLGR